MFATGYYASYLFVRSNREITWADGRYRIVSMHHPVISDNIAIILYWPLIRLDEATTDPYDLGVKPE